MDISQIRKLIRLIQASDVTEIEVTEGDQTVRISRREHVISVPQHQTVVAASPVAVPQQTVPAAASATPSEVAEDHGEHVVKSPMVGTFYRSASPEADPFVSEGTRVKKGDTLCIIEAMKLMNEIEAEYNGVVEEILVENASPLEYGQPIFVITPLV